MKRLVCEMCGGTDLVKQEGVFVCQSCGCKYSMEEARKMMVEVEGTVEVTGTVKVDNSAAVDNYLTMAQSSYDTGNKAEAEGYCNKAIEIAPDNWKAWALKGKATGWQSTMARARLNEYVSAFCTAYANAPETEKDALRADAESGYVNLAIALIVLRGNNFAKWPSRDSADKFVPDVNRILENLHKLNEGMGAHVDEKQLRSKIAEKLNLAAVSAHNDKIYPDYIGNPNDPNGKPTQYRWEKFIELGSVCVDLTKYAISLCDETDPGNEQRCKNIIFLHEEAMKSCSWSSRYVNGVKRWYEDWHLTDEAKALRRKEIEKYQGIMDKIKAGAERKAKEEKQQRIDAYWAEHQEEKAALEREKREMEEQKTALNRNLQDITAKDEAPQLRRQIKSLYEQKSSLGLFKTKEKNAIQEQIDELEGKARTMEKETDDARRALEDKLKGIRGRIQEIDEELSKDR